MSTDQFLILRRVEERHDDATVLWEEVATVTLEGYGYATLALKKLDESGVLTEGEYLVCDVPSAWVKRLRVTTRTEFDIEVAA